MKPLPDHDRARLRWRARRGLLENDLILTRFLDRYEERLTDADVSALMLLLEMGDNDLLDVLLVRAEPKGQYDVPGVHDLIGRMRAL